MGVIEQARGWLKNLSPEERQIAMTAADLHDKLKHEEASRADAAVARASLARNIGMAQQASSLTAAQMMELQRQQALAKQSFGSGMAQMAQTTASFDPLAGLSLEEKDEVRQELVAMLSGQGIYHGDPEFNEKRRQMLPGAMAVVQQRRAQRAREERSPNNRPAYRVTLSALKDTWRALHGDQWVDVGAPGAPNFIKGMDDPSFWADAYFRLDNVQAFEKTPDGWVRLHED